MKTEQPQPQYTLTLRAIPGYRGEPKGRLRAALKTLKRAYGFRCVTMAEDKPEGSRMAEQCGERKEV